MRLGGLPSGVPTADKRPSEAKVKRRVGFMKALVEFCSSNVASYTKPVITALEQDAELDVDVVEYGCLGHCGECYMVPFALVNGDFVSAATAEELLAKIKQKLREDEAALEDFPF